MKQHFRAWAAGVSLVLMTSASFGAAYSTTGAGTSTIGSGGDYPSIAAACAAISNTTNNNTVTLKSLTTNVAQLTLSAASTFAVGNSITVNIGDPVFDGTFTVTVSAGSTVSYARTSTNVASTAASGNVYTTAGTGTRDASAWTFEILNDLTENVNSEIRCAVNAAGSITFKPASGVRPTVTWPATINANAQSSGHISIGTTNGGTTIAYTDTANIRFDGNNGVAAGTRDMVFQNQQGDLEGAIGIIRVRGNNDGIWIKNMVINDPNSATATAQAITFTSDVATAATNKCPDNWVVDNCQISMNTNAGASSAIIASNSGTITATQAQLGWSITNNILTGGSRLIDLNQSGTGTVRGNTIHASNNGGNLGACIYLRGTNTSAGNTINIDRNNIDSIVYGNNATGGDFGQFGVYLLPSPTVAGTINVTNNIIGGWSFGQLATTDQSYAAIVIGSAATSAAGLVVNVEHNSINMNNNAFWPGTTAGRVGAIIRRHTTTGCTLSLKNNLIRYLQTGTNSAAVFTTVAGNVTASGNCIFASGTNFGSIGGTVYANFAAWQGAGFDVTGGQNVNPAALASGSWVVSSAQSGNDLHFSNSTVTGLAATGVVTALNTDVDGEARAVGGTALPGADVTNPPAAATYTWNVNGSGDSRTAANWSPARTTPGWNDTLVIDGGVTAGPVTLTNVADQHLAGLKVINSVTATLSTFGGVNRLWLWNGDAAATADFSVGAGSTLNLIGNGGIALDLNACTGSVAGDLNLQATTNGTPNRITCKTANAFLVASGGSVGYSPSSGGTSVAPFGSYIGETTINGVEFQSGSKLHFGAISTGLRGGGSLANPFAFTAPNSAVQFDSGSDYVNWEGTPSITGRTYGGNYVHRASLAPFAIGGGALWTLNGSWSTASPGGGSASVTNVAKTANVATLTYSGLSGTAFVVGQGITVALTPADANFDVTGATVTAVTGSTISYTLAGADVGSVAATGAVATSKGAWTMTGAGSMAILGNFTVTASCAAVSLAGSTGATHSFGGNIDVQDVSLFTPSAVATTMLLNGTADQSMNFAGGTLATLSLTKATGNVNMAGSVKVSGTTTLNLTAGVVNTSANTLEIGTAVGTPGTLIRTAGRVVGNLKRWIAASTGNRLFPVGTASTGRDANVNFTVAPGVGGSLTATFTASDPGGSGLPLAADIGIAADSASANGFWGITAGDGLSGGTYDATVDATGFTAGPLNSGWRLLKRANNVSAWTLDGTNAANVGAVIARSGLAGFSEFGIGFDSIAPVVGTVATVDHNNVDVTFTDGSSMGSGVATAANYTISNTGQGTLTANPDSSVVQSGNTYRLNWLSGGSVTGAPVTITVAGAVQDAAGNALGGTNAGTDPSALPVSVSAFTIE